MLFIGKAVRPVIFVLGCAILLMLPATLAAQVSDNLSPIYSKVGQRPPNVVTLMLGHAEAMQDKLSIKLATKELDLLAHPEKIQKKLY